MHDTKVSTTFFTDFVFFVSDYVQAMYFKVVKLFLGGNALIKYVYEYCYWFWLPHACKFDYLNCLNYLKT